MNWNNLSEKSNTKISKLMIDREDDFKFHRAYLAYAASWDDNNSDEARTDLNDLIDDLSNNKINYHTFYAQLNHFRRSVEYRSRALIQGQRKKEWQKKEAKS